MMKILPDQHRVLAVCNAAVVGSLVRMRVVLLSADGVIRGKALKATATMTATASASVVP